MSIDSYIALDYIFFLILSKTLVILFELLPACRTMATPSTQQDYIRAGSVLNLKMPVSLSEIIE